MKRRLLANIAVSTTIVATVFVGVPGATAASGDVSTATITPPSALTGLAVAATQSARDGGMYYAYTSGNNYKMFKTKPDGTLESTFGTAGVVDIPGVSTAVTGSRRLNLTSDVSGKWWAAMMVSPTNQNSGNSDIRIIGGGATGAPTIDFVISQSASWAACAAAYPSITGAATWLVQNVRVYPKRSNGLWLGATCTAWDNSQSLTGPESVTVLMSVTDAGVTGTPIGLNNTLGSGGPCFSNSLISDPTGASGTPEFYVVRSEHNILVNGQCTANTNSATAAQVTGYSIVKVAADGTTSTVTLASAGDASDGLLSPRIDPGGRLLLVNVNLADRSTITIRRLKTDGVLDTSIGSSGITTVNVGAAPAGQAALTASITGIITTPTKVYLAIILADRQLSTNSCSSTTTYTWGWRYAVASPSDGTLTSFGTNGVGGRVTLVAPENTVCTTPVSGGQSVDTDGQPRIVTFDGGAAKLHTWEAPTGANGGGEGGTNSGGPTTDTGGAASTGDGLQVRLQNPTTTTVVTTTTVAPTTTTTVPTTAMAPATPARLTAATKERPILFRSLSSALSQTARLQIAAIAVKAKGASRIVVEGHSGMLYDLRVVNFRVSLQRAKAVRAALRAAGVTIPIKVVNKGWDNPVVTAKTESAQARNRRVVVRLYP